jgi:hypothetical protein
MIRTRLRGPRRRSSPKASRQLAASPAVTSAEINCISEVTASGDPVIAASYYPGDANIWPLQPSSTFGLRTTNAWGLTTGTSHIRAAVLDTGASHYEIPLWDYQIDTTQTLPSTSASIESPHGTGVAGIMSEKLNNAFRIGVAPNTPLLSYKIASGASEPYMASGDALYRALFLAQQQGARVVNMSLSSGVGGGAPNGLAMTRGWGMVNVAAAGNSNDRTGNGVTYGIGFPGNQSSVFTIGATTQTGARWDTGGGIGSDKGSNYGIGLTFVAPGAGPNFAVATPGNSYTENYRGTSYSSPFVAGVSALMLSVNPTLDADDVWNMLLRTARRSLPNRGTELWNEQTGWGLIDAGAAVQEAAKLSPVDLVYSPSGRQVSLWTGYESRIGFQGAGVTRLVTHDASGSLIGNVTHWEANMRPRFIGIGARNRRTVRWRWMW